MTGGYSSSEDEAAPARPHRRGSGGAIARRRSSNDPDHHRHHNGDAACRYRRRNSNSSGSGGVMAPRRVSVSLSVTAGPPELQYFTTQDSIAEAEKSTAKFLPHELHHPTCSGGHQSPPDLQCYTTQDSITVAKIGMGAAEQSGPPQLGLQYWTTQDSIAIAKAGETSAPCTGLRPLELQRWSTQDSITMMKTTTTQTHLPQELPCSTARAISTTGDKLVHTNHGTLLDGMDDDDDDKKDVTNLYGYTVPNHHNQHKPRRRNSTSSRRSSLDSTHSSRRSARRHRRLSNEMNSNFKSYGLTRTSSMDTYDTDDDQDFPGSHNHHISARKNSISSVNGRRHSLSNSILLFGYDSDAKNKCIDQEDIFEADGSITSSKRSRRRNSCIIPNVNQAHLQPLRLMEPDTMADEDEDPDSLWNRAQGNLPPNTRTPSLLMPACVNAADSAENDSQKLHEDKAPALVQELTPSATIDINKATVSAPWRNSPLTIPHATLTENNLPKNKSVPSADGWGHLEVGGCDEDLDFCKGSDNASTMSYGVSLYAEPGASSLKELGQKARRRASMEICDIVPQKFFKPAAECTNASDFVVRCFSARLRCQGFTVLKHNKSRWSKTKHRILYLMADGKTLTWKNVDEPAKDLNNGDAANNKIGLKISNIQVHATSSSNHKSQNHSKIDLTLCTEVRYGLSPDPASRKKLGTSVLRARLCQEQSLLGKSFSLIFQQRTLDFTAFSNDQCKVLLEGLSALCFRLQLMQNVEGNFSSGENTIKDYNNADADWASTVYGGESTVTSLAQTIAMTPTTSVPVTLQPWGN